MPEGIKGERFKPQPETIEWFSERVQSFFEGFLSHIPEDQEQFSSEEAVRVIKFPSDTTYTRERLSALIVHELGTHAMRAIPYQSQEIKPFATGLPGNETFDEGVAGCVEQAIKGGYKDFGVDHYINIGLATSRDLC